MKNLKDIKSDFPIFSTEGAHLPDGQESASGGKVKSSEKPLVFLDNAAVSQMPQVVINAVSEFYSAYKANVHSGIYSIGTRAVEAYENARKKIAAFLGVHGSEIIFTSGTTASLNMASRMLERIMHIGDEIVISGMEHHSNFIPWQELAKRTNAVFTMLPLEEDGTLLLETVRHAVSRRTKIVAITHVSHVTGAVNNVREICRIAHESGALCVVDAAQSASHMPVRIREIDCDFLACSGQKMLGPTGIGILYGKEEHLQELDPVVFGGGMIRSVDADASTWAEPPQKFEAGTPHIAGVIGMGAAVSYLEAIGLEVIASHEQNLAMRARQALQTISGVQLYGPRNEKESAGIISFNVPGIHAHDVAEILSHENIAVRAGHHCALPLMKHFGISGTVRASFYVYNTEEDVKALQQGVVKAIDIFRKK